MPTHSALGKGLGSLIPERHSFVEKVIPSARQQVLDISVDDIVPNPRQPRSLFSASELEDLIESIKEHGILQPLVVTQSRKGFELIAGERRLRAARTLGLKTVPAIVRAASEQEKLELALIENVQRQDLNAVEEAYAFRALIEEFNLTQEEVATRVGKSRSAVANGIRVLELPEEMLGAITSGKITKSHARTLLAEPDHMKRDLLFHSMLDGGVTVRQAEHAVRGLIRKRGSSSLKDPNILAQEKRLREALGTKVSIQKRTESGTITIHFYSQEEFKSLLERLSS